MSDEGSVTRWIGSAKGGDPAAAQKLWEAYFQKMVRLAQARLRGGSRRVADEEDAALSAFDSFVRGAAAGRFPRLHDRDDLWRLLVVLTTRKAIDQVQHERRLKRGGGLVAGQGGEEEDLLERAISAEPTAEQAAGLAEDVGRLLGMLGDPELRLLALLKLEGFTNEEAAQRLGCARVTVQRMLAIIRQAWAAEVGP